MRVIHGVWAHGLSNHGALCLWAEDPDLPPRPAAAPPGVHLARPHPFACQAAELADLLAGSASTAAGDAVRKAVHDELTLRLPSAGGGPLASPELVRPEAPAAPGAPGGSVPRSGSGPARPGVAGGLAGARAGVRPRLPRWRCWVNPDGAAPARPATPPWPAGR